MNRRRTLAIVGVALLVSLSGCTLLGGTTTNAELFESAEYGWDTDTDVVIDLGEDEYAAIHQIENRSSVRIYHSTRYGIENPIPIRAVQFRHPNGTVVNASAMDISESRSAVNVELPAEEGQLAYIGPKRDKEFQTPAITDGSYTVKVPPGHDVENFILGTVRPRGAETTTVDGRVHVIWDQLGDGTIEVSYYLVRDLYLFGGLVVAASIAALIALGMVYRQIQELRREREEMGIDIDADDSSDGPPPGMR